VNALIQQQPIEFVSFAINTPYYLSIVVDHSENFQVIVFGTLA
jgi:hypothetical protein